MKQRSTCRWCKKGIERAAETARWESGFFGGNGNPECDQAPNPDEGPMPPHDPGTAVMNQDGTIARCLPPERSRREVNTPEELQAHVEADPGTTLAGEASPALVQAALAAGLIRYTTETGRALGDSGDPVIVRRYYAARQA